jgi:hypothetical protein
MADREILNPAAQGNYGSSPYGDQQEVTGPPKPIIDIDFSTEFRFTDARSVMVILHPHHWNFIKNPACRNDTAGWVFRDTVPTLDQDDSWVGQSLVMEGPLDDTISFSDTDKDGNAAPVYVGPLYTDNEKNWYEHGRGSPEWTFSVYAKGKGSVRLSMYAYTMDGNDPMSPPTGTGAPSSDDPANEPYSASTPYLVGPDGNLWEAATAPFYRSIGRPQYSPDPSTASPVDSLPLLVQDASDVLWERTLDIYPYYSSFGAPAEVEDPASEPNGDLYLRDSLDRSLWKLKDPVPPPHVPDPEDGGVPAGWYYHRISAPAVGTTDDLRPDSSWMSQYLADPSGDLWELDPAAVEAPFYALVGTPVVVTEPPLDMEPSDPLLVVRSETPDPSVDGVVWTTSGPYYTDTGSPAYFESVVGQWVDIEAAEEWHRVLVRTDSRDTFYSQDSISFLGVAWIDAVIEVRNEDGDTLKISAAMLDAREAPEAEYFDGDMVESAELDDFLWMGEPNGSVSLYYYDRALRARWLHYAMNFMAPADRPYQIYFHDINLPYVPTEGMAASVANGATTLII